MHLGVDIVVSKLLLCLYYSDYLENFESTYNSIDEAYDYTDKLKIAKIDGDENKKFIKQFNVQGFPSEFLIVEL